MIYHHIAGQLTEKGRLKFDALLGDPEAVAEREAERQSAFGAFAPKAVAP